MVRRRVNWSDMKSPVGHLVLAATDRGLCFLTFQTESTKEKTLDRLKHRLFKWITGSIDWTNDEQVMAPFLEQVNDYFLKKRKKFDLPLDLYGTDFQQKVWKYLQTIPYGECRSYQEVAEAIGRPRAVRAVGGANHQNPIAIICPCHRVIGADGSLVGYGGGLDRKRYLLNHEGWGS